MLYKIEKTQTAYTYIINGNIFRYFILTMLVLFASMYFFAQGGQENISIIAFYLAFTFGILYFLALSRIGIHAFISAIKGKKIKKTVESTGMGWGKNNFLWKIEIER